MEPIAYNGLAEQTHAVAAALDLAVVQPLQRGLGLAAAYRDVGELILHLDLADLISGQTGFSGQCAENIARTQFILAAAADGDGGKFRRYRAQFATE